MVGESNIIENNTTTTTTTVLLIITINIYIYMYINSNSNSTNNNNNIVIITMTTKIMKQTTYIINQTHGCSKQTTTHVLRFFFVFYITMCVCTSQSSFDVVLGGDTYLFIDSRPNCPWKV